LRALEAVQEREAELSHCRRAGDYGQWDHRASFDDLVGNQHGQDGIA
jgi:hypothetical protein